MGRAGESPVVAGRMREQEEAVVLGIKIRWVALAFSFLAAALANQASAQPGPVIAVFAMEDRGSGCAAGVLDNLTSYLASLLTEGGFQVIPPEQVKQRITAQKVDSFKNCFDQGCQIEIGRELAAQKTLSTQVLRIADSCQVTAVLYDLKKATAEAAVNAEASCDEKALLSTIRSVAARLAEIAVPKTAAVLPAADRLLKPFLLEDLRGRTEALLWGALFVTPDVRLVPRIGATYAIGDFTLGARGDIDLVPWADQVEPLMVLGYRHCFEGRWALCLGGGLNGGLRFSKTTSNGQTTESTSVPIQPRLEFGASDGGIFLQAELGVLVESFASYSGPSASPPGSVQVGLGYGIGVGYQVLSWLALLAEFSGTSSLNWDVAGTVLAFGGSLRLRIGHWLPFGGVKVILPSNKITPFGRDPQVGLVGGLNYEF